MNPLKQMFMGFIERIIFWLKHCLQRILVVFPKLNNCVASTHVTHKGSCPADSEEWKTNETLCTYHLGDGKGAKVTVQTTTHTFHVDLRRLSECSEYFRALSQSDMKETSESLIHLEHVSSSIFHNLLEFSFNHDFKVPQEELGAHIQVSSYLFAEAFLLKCLSVLADELNPSNCLSYLSLAQEIFCVELKNTVFIYLSRNLLELPHVMRSLNAEEKEEVVNLRVRGERHLCSLRKENLTSWKDPETERARHIFTMNGPEDSGDWHPVTELPFRADKWCFTAVVLYNYLYVIGGYRQRMKRGWEFNMASFRYNPFTHSWVPTSPLIKHRRHFSAVACEGCIYAVGGWYLDSLVTPDSSTALYTAVERYDPWEDTWSLGECVYVLGSIQRTGEKLLLQYNTKQDSWSELLPTLTRADADLPILYFLGASDKLLIIGGNNSGNVVTSFCVKSKKWGQAHRAEKMAFAGQGTLVGDRLLMPSIEHNSVVQMDVQTLSITAFPPLPVSMCYEAVFYLYF
ncbi:kelch repeat and BTB domain-containing protein 11 isoform X2 [Kryptolebias marmoratus]|uniref:kelch repeat and BTB domain-containing protein 11 isoform X2 n=1 Tax=Kryptolebias marmoratus TaxID=37003 RepID=UPI000D52FEA5|nr:kelch repeat and BTB domain-containing protein 11 isoform X2 [Kryptolebias marmoratus]